MSKDMMRYDRLVENALRGVVIEALRLASAKGLPGDHHFYVTFRTDHPKVELSAEILARHPGEMTVVLEHKFWDLDVGDEVFSVTLSFSNVQERIVVPYEAITAFADPSVKFGLRFQALDIGPTAGAGLADVEVLENPAEATPTNLRKKKTKGVSSESPAEVVTLDSFRKK